MASVLSVLVIMSLMVAVPVSAIALPETVKNDYQSGERTGNFITNVSATDLLDKSWNNLAGGGAGYLREGIWSISESSDVPVDLTTDNDDHGVAGPKFKTTLFNKATNITNGKTIVVGAKMKATAGAPQVKSAYSLYNSTPIYPVEFPGALGGQSIPGDWIDWGNTLVINSAQTDQLRIGFAYTGIENEGTRSIQIQAESLYIGEQYAYDLKINASDTSFYAGETISVDADVINQVYSTGTLSQNVTWYVANEEKTEQVAGFTIVPEANGVATISVDSSVAEGMYKLIAVSEVYSALVKSIDIEVTAFNLYEEHVPDEVARAASNILTGNYSNRWVGSMMGSCSVVSGGVDRQMTAGATTVALPIDGSYLHPLVGYKADTNVPADTTGRVVFSFSVKRITGKSVVNVARKNDHINQSTNPATTEYPIEYERYTGIEPGTEYTSLKGSFADTGAPANKYYYYMGFVNGTETGAQFYSKIADEYIGYEYAYDLEVKADSTELNAENTNINIEYAVLNQIGEKGSIDQDVELLVTTPDRKTVLTDTGITIIDNGDGTAQVKLDPFNAVVGSYDIVAYSAEYGMAKGITITVPESEMITSLELSEFDGNKVTAEFMIMNKGETSVNAIMVVVMVNNKNNIQDIITERITNVNSASGLKTYTKTLTATDLSKVTKAKVFVFDCGDSEEPSMFSTNMKELAESITVLK